MASLRDIIKQVIEAKAATKEPEVFGRAGGIPAGAPVKPIAGLRSRLAGPVNQRDYGALASDQPTPQPVQPATAAAATPAPAQLAQSLRAAQPEVVQQTPPPPMPAAAPAGQVETVPFVPEPLDEGTPLEPEEHTVDEPLSEVSLLEREGDSGEMAASEGGTPAQGEEAPIDLGTIVLRVGDDVEDQDAELESTAQELGQRMLDALAKDREQKAVHEGGQEAAPEEYLGPRPNAARVRFSPEEFSNLLSNALRQ